MGDPLLGGSLEVDPLPADRAGDHLHGAGAPAAHDDPPRVVPSRREESGVPVEQALFREGLFVVACCVQHQFDDAFDVPVHVQQPAGAHAEPPGDRRPHLLRVEVLALDLAALHYLLGQCVEHSLLAEVETERLHAAQQPPLLVPCGGKPLNQLFRLPPEVGPVGLLMDILSPHHMR